VVALAGASQDSVSPPGTIGVGPSSAATGFFLGGIRPPRQVAAAFKLAERKSAEENEHVMRRCDEKDEK
jgi:hypothetical protein